MKRNSIAPYEPNTKMVSRKEGYFCSELVAACFKVMGLINQKISCAKFWPVTFSNKKKILFLKDAKLGNEMQVILKVYSK